MRALARLLLPAGVDPAVLPLLVGTRPARLCRRLRRRAVARVPACARLRPVRRRPAQHGHARRFGGGDAGRGCRRPPLAAPRPAARRGTADDRDRDRLRRRLGVLAAACRRLLRHDQPGVRRCERVPPARARAPRARGRSRRAHRALRALFADRFAVRRGRRPGRRIAALAGRGRQRPVAFRAAGDVRPLCSDRRGDLGDVPPAPGRQGRIGARSHRRSDLRAASSSSSPRSSASIPLPAASS